MNGEIQTEKKTKKKKHTKMNTMQIQQQKQKQKQKQQMIRTKPIRNCGKPFNLFKNSKKKIAKILYNLKDLGGCGHL